VRDTKEFQAYPDGSAASVALYIGALTGELGQLARANGFDALSYLLDMARLEADEVLKGSGLGKRCKGSPAQRRSG
jgi:hypothetical protein